MNCKSTLSCINLFEYLLLVSPPLNKVKIPIIKTIATAPINVKPMKLNKKSVINILISWAIH